MPIYIVWKTTLSDGSPAWAIGYRVNCSIERYGSYESAKKVCDWYNNFCPESEEVNEIRSWRQG